jgi:LiaF transmembrane domain
VWSRHRSLVWPAILILVGVLALLANTGMIPTDRLYLLVDLWPLVLIVIGVEIIVRRRLSEPLAVSVGLAVVVVAVAGAAVYVAYSPNPEQTRTLDSVAPSGGIDSASLELDVGGATLRIASDATLGDHLYRAHIEYSGSAPTVEFDARGGRLRISQSGGAFPSLRNDRFTMDLALNAATAWSIVENSGAVTETLNIPDVKLQNLEINTGASREEITVGAPSGVVPIHVNGGALTVTIHRAGGADASVHVSGGAVALTADGHVYHAIGSASYETAGQGSDRYMIEVNGGACTVTLDSTKGAPPPQS